MPAGADTQTTTISARIPHDDVAALKSIAERNHSTVSRLVAVCIKAGLPTLGGRGEPERTATA